MNAKECYDAVIKARNDQDQAIKEKVFNGIRKSVQSNLLYYLYEGKISKELLDELEQAGFKVTAAQERNESYTEISWDLS